MEGVNGHGKSTFMNLIYYGFGGRVQSFNKLENSNNSEYWISKIWRNRERDDEVNKKLLFMGWTVIRFWGNDIKKHTDECVKVIEEAILDIKIGDEEL